MKQRRANPLYSPLGCGSAVILLLILVAILYFVGPGLFSPGNLSAATTEEVSIEDYSSHADMEQECQQCHSAWLGVSVKLCLSCHTTIASERETQIGLHGRLLDSGLCTDCHTEHGGAEANVTVFDVNDFQHDSLTDFSLIRHELNYENEALICSDCHLPDRYLASMVDCIACHDSAEPQFIREHISLFGSKCLDCHDGLDSMADFEHSLVFPLDGAHQSVSCTECHNQPIRNVETRMCVDCHSEPEVHFGLFGSDCIRCHTAVAWTPAQLTQHMFPLDHGDQDKIECITCHLTSYTEYTCYGCHEHEQSEIVEKHEDEGITSIENCAECHPSGLEDEA